jgi:hypothetical protein
MRNKADKLSKLQRWILTEALRIEVLKAYSDDYCSRVDVLTGYFGLPISGSRYFRSPRGFRDVIRKTAEPAEYNKANASMYRALRRLFERGLLLKSRFPGKILLSDEGRRVAGLIDTANTAAKKE